MVCHLELKPGVRLHGTSPEILFAVEIIREVWEEYGSPMCRVTAGVDGAHSALGEHYKGAALDFSTRTILTPVSRLVSTPEESRVQLVREAVAKVASRLVASPVGVDERGNMKFQGSNFFLLLEDVGQPNEHLHVSYRPQAFGG